MSGTANTQQDGMNPVNNPDQTEITQPGSDDAQADGTGSTDNTDQTGIQDEENAQPDGAGSDDAQPDGAGSDQTDDATEALPPPMQLKPTTLIDTAGVSLSAQALHNALMDSDHSPNDDHPIAHILTGTSEYKPSHKYFFLGWDTSANGYKHIGKTDDQTPCTHAIVCTTDHAGSVNADMVNAAVARIVGANSFSSDSTSVGVGMSVTAIEEVNTNDNGDVMAHLEYKNGSFAKLEGFKMYRLDLDYGADASRKYVISYSAAVPLNDDELRAVFAPYHEGVPADPSMSTIISNMKTFMGGQVPRTIHKVSFVKSDNATPVFQKTTGPTAAPTGDPMYAYVVVPYEAP